jgi:6-phosphogluconolactonase
MSLLHIYVGAYTQDLGWVKGQAKGIMLYALDPVTGEMLKLSEIASDNPSYLAVHPSGKFLFSTNESASFGLSSDNAISSFAIAEDGALSLLNQQPSLGKDPCYVGLEPGGKFILSANYGGGNFVMYPIAEDGKLAEASDSTQQGGVVDADETQKKSPHAHSINVAAGGKYALGCDLGLDKVFIYRLDLLNGRLLPHSEAVVKTGSGPRHLAFHPNGKYVYLINELNSTITVFAWDGAAGLLSEIQTISTVPDHFAEPTWCADVQVHPNGKFVYGSNRGHDSIAIYRVDEQTGQLLLLGHELTRGKTPRNFALTLLGDLLLVANQDSNTVVVFRVDSDTGALRHLRTNAVPTPVCLKFAHSQDG